MAIPDLDGAINVPRRKLRDSREYVMGFVESDQALICDFSPSGTSQWSGARRRCREIRVERTRMESGSNVDGISAPAYRRSKITSQTAPIWSRSASLDDYAGKIWLKDSGACPVRALFYWQEVSNSANRRACVLLQTQLY